MTALNLLLIPVLWLLGLFDGDGGGDAGTAGTTDGGSTKSSDSATKTDAGTKTDTATKTDATADDLGEAGKRAIAEERKQRRAEKDRADAAEAELQRLRDATQSESEKAVNDAKKAGASEERAKWEGLIRRTRVESALTAAGCNDAAIASLASDFTDLKITDTGDVEDLTATVESFKTAHPTLFTARVPSGSADQGARPNSDAQVQPGLDRLRHAYTESSSTKTS